MLRTSPVVVGAANTEFVLGNERLTSTGQKSELAAGEAQQTQIQGGAPAPNFGFAFGLKPEFGWKQLFLVNFCYSPLCGMLMLSKMRGKFSLLLNRKTIGSSLKK